MKTMEISPEEKMGDLALPCFAMAKKMRKNPMLIATELVEKLNEQKDELGIYVISLATAFNKFYHDCSILQAGEKEKMARLLLVDIVQKVLSEACGLLGMECP